jgi:hypothetical protein
MGRFALTTPSTLVLLATSTFAPARWSWTGEASGLGAISTSLSNQFVDPPPAPRDVILPGKIRADGGTDRERTEGRLDDEAPEVR